MGIVIFHANLLVRLRGVEHRLIRKISDTCWQLENTQTLRITDSEQEELEKLYVTEKLTFVHEQGLIGPLPSQNISDEHWELIKNRLHYVQAVLDVRGCKDLLVGRLDEAWESLGSPEVHPSVASVLRWRKRYLRSGNDVHSLLPRNAAKGNRVPRFPIEIEELCKQAIDEVYLSPERPTEVDTLNRALYLVKQANALCPASQALKLPTRRLIRSIIGRIPAFDRFAARFGYQAATVHFRNVKGHCKAAAPLDLAEMDHAVLDVMVVDERTFLPLGRPWLTCCIDVHTRCVMGIYIGFTRPSFYSVAQCLLHAFSPKAELKQQYPMIKNGWNAHGVMRELVLDNGQEFHGRALEQCCMSLGISMRYSARKTPWHKPHIERFLGTFNRSVSRLLPGTTFDSIISRGDYDPKKHAVITLESLRTLANIWVADVYHQQRHRSLGMSPAQMWHSSINPDLIPIPDSLSKLKVVMAREYDRVLTHSGVGFECLQYNSNLLGKLRRLYGAKANVKIRVDESDLGSLYVIHPQHSEPIKVPALRPEYATGLSLYQHKLIRAFALKEGRFLDNSDGWLKAKALMTQILAQRVGKKASIAQLADPCDAKRGVIPTTHEGDVLPIAINPPSHFDLSAGPEWEVVPCASIRKPWRTKQ